MKKLLLKFILVINILFLVPIYSMDSSSDKELSDSSISLVSSTSSDSSETSNESDKSDESELKADDFVEENEGYQVEGDQEQYYGFKQVEGDQEQYYGFEQVEGDQEQVEGEVYQDNYDGEQDQEASVYNYLFSMIVKAAQTGDLSGVYNKILNFDCFNQEGFTPLYIAAKHGNINVIKLLLYLNSDPNIVMSSNGFTALHTACYYGYADIVELLLNSGAKITTSENNRYTPFHLAARGNHIKVLEILLKHDQEVRKNLINAYDAEGFTAFHYAIMKGNLNIIKLLFKYGAKLDLKTGKLKAAEHFIIISKKQKIQKIKESEGNYSQLFLACKSNNYGIVKFLLEQFKEQLEIDNNQEYNNCLMFTIYNANLELFKLLFEKTILSNRLIRGVDKKDIIKALLNLKIMKYKKYKKFRNYLWTCDNRMLWKTIRVK